MKTLDESGFPSEVFPESDGPGIQNEACLLTFSENWPLEHEASPHASERGRAAAATKLRCAVRTKHI